MPKVEWLLRDATEEWSVAAGERVSRDDDRLQATFERICIGSGLRVFLVNAVARRDVTVRASDARTSLWIGSQITVKGKADLDFLDGARATASADSALLFRPSGHAAAYTIAGGDVFRSAGYGIDIERIRRLFDDDVPAVLHPLLEPQPGVSRVLTTRGGRSLRNIAAGMFAAGLCGPLRSLMMEGAVIQLLAVQANAAAPLVPARRREVLSAREREAIDAAHRLLLADMRAPPSLGELAGAVGLSERRLNAGFRAVFGGTVFEILRRRRLEHARIALEYGDVPLKQIAYRVGYNHVTNFINAFSAQYGAPPLRHLGRRRTASPVPSGTPEDG